MPYITLYSDWADLDSKVFRSVNGDLGGNWCPTTPIFLGGAGLALHGPLRVDFGGSLTTSNGARFMIGDGDHPRFAEGHPLRKRKITTPCCDCQTTPKYQFRFVVESAGIRAVDVRPAGNPPRSFILPLRVHDGATMIAATLTWRVTLTHKAVPAAAPRMRILRCDKDGNSVPMTSTAKGADALGYVAVPLPETAQDYPAAGVLNKLEITCDQNNEIDTSQYMYFAQVQDELAPAGSPTTFEEKANVKFVYTANVAITGSPGGGVANGDRVLLTKQTIEQQNGIWIVNTGGAWTRAIDAATGSQFTPFFIVTEIPAWSVWQYTGSANPTVTADATGTALPFAPAGETGLGSEFLGVISSFDHILDMRPQ